MPNDPDSPTPSDERKPRAIDRPDTVEHSGNLLATEDQVDARASTTAATRAPTWPTPGVPVAAARPAQGAQDRQSATRGQSFDIDGAFHDLDGERSVSDLSEYAVGRTSAAPAFRYQTRAAQDLPEDFESVGSVTDRPEEWDVLGLNESQLPEDLKLLLKIIEEEERTASATPRQDALDEPGKREQQPLRDQQRNDSSATPSAQPLPQLEERILGKEKKFEDEELRIIKKLGPGRYREGYDERYEAHQFALQKLKSHYGERSNVASSEVGPAIQPNQPVAATKVDQPVIADTPKEKGVAAAPVAENAPPTRDAVQQRDLSPLPWSPPREQRVALSGGGDRSVKSDASSVTIDPAGDTRPRQAAEPLSSVQFNEGFRARVAAAQARLEPSVNQIETRNPRVAGKSRVAPEVDDLWDDDESSASPEPVKPAARRRRAPGNVRNPAAEPDADGWLTTRRSTVATTPGAPDRNEINRPHARVDRTGPPIPNFDPDRARPASRNSSPNDDIWSTSSLITQPPPREIDNRVARARSLSMSDLSDDGSSSGSSTQSANLLPPPAKRSRTDDRDRSSGNTR